MPITKRLERCDGVIYVTDAQTGKALLAVSETFGLANGDVMKMLRRLVAGQLPANGEDARRDEPCCANCRHWSCVGDGPTGVGRCALANKATGPWMPADMHCGDHERVAPGAE